MTEKRDVDKSSTDKCYKCESYRNEIECELLPEVVEPRPDRPDLVEQWICVECENKGLGMK